MFGSCAADSFVIKQIRYSSEILQNTQNKSTEKRITMMKDNKVLEKN